MAQAAAANRKTQPAPSSRAVSLRQALASFAAVVACYWLYWLLAVPLIEPSVEVRSTQVASDEQIDEARGDVNSRQRDVAQYFAANDWERANPAIWQSGRMRLLFKTIEPQPDGSVALRPCTLMFFPEEDGTATERPIIMRAVEGANVRFDQPIVLKRADFAKRRFVGGDLLGQIRIYRQESAAGAGDDLEITTPRGVQMAGERAWTDAPVNFRFGRSFGSGRDLEILFGAANGKAKPDVMRDATFRTLRLKRDVKMRLELGSGPLAGQAPPGRPDAPPTPIEITCQGPFEFDGQEYAASFRDAVDVLRINPSGPSDQLNCALLSVYFARGKSEVRMIEARGNPVILRSPARGMYARCKGIDYIPGAPGSPGSLAAFGPGVIQGNLPDDPGGNYVAQWARQLRFEPDGPLQRATLRGATQIRIGQMGTITADEVFAWLSRQPQPPGAARKPADAAAPDEREAADGWQLERVVARRYPEPQAPSQGDVVIDGPQLHAETGTLEATIDRTVGPAPNGPAAAQPGGAGRRQQRGPQNPGERFDVRGRGVHLALVPRGADELTITAATILGDAELKQLASGAGGPNALLVKGDRLHVAGADSPDTKVTISGKPGYVEAGGMTLWGSAIELERRTNLLWINGPGRLVLPVTQDLDGRALGRPSVLTVDWKERMDFRLDTATFQGTVVARSEQQVLNTEKLEATLTKAIDFSNPDVAVGGKGGERPDLAAARSYGRTSLESRQLDEQAVQTSFSRMELFDLSIDRASGQIRGRGPGWVKHVSRGAGPQLLVPGQEEKKKEPPAAAPDNQFTYLHVAFQKGIEGNINNRAIKFFDRTKTVYGPVTDWNATLDGNDLAALGPQGMLLNAGALEVREMTRRPDSQRGWFELDATDGVFAEGQRFTAQGDRLTYAEEKDRLVLRGDPAEMYLENNSGPRHETRAAEVHYWFARHYFWVSGAQSVSVVLPPDGQGGKKPKPPAAGPR